MTGRRDDGYQEPLLQESWVAAIDRRLTLATSIREALLKDGRATGLSTCRDQSSPAPAFRRGSVPPAVDLSVGRRYQKDVFVKISCPKRQGRLFLFKQVAKAKKLRGQITPRNWTFATRRRPSPLGGCCVRTLLFPDIYLRVLI